MRGITPFTRIAVVIALLGSCALDEREVQLALPTTPAAGGSDPGLADAIGVLPDCIDGVDCAATGPESSGTTESPALTTELDTSSLAPTSVSGGSGICNDAGVCTCDPSVESCAPISLCGDAGADCDVNCSGCLIGAECFAVGAANVSNPCQICDPQRGPSGWSSNDGELCDDGQFCTTDDSCTDSQCAGLPRDCEDGVACNGTSTCDEAADTCSPGINQCPNGTICNVATGACASTCSGCLIAGVCLLNGAEEAGNPCRICDPAQSTTAYSPAAGKACGAAATACSQQDTCDAQGACRPNHLAVGAPCGDSASSACDQADACDGNGACQARRAANDSACDDGQFCTVGDTCQGGRCTATGNRNCGANQACNEGANQCQCQGCVVNGTCFAAGARNGNNPCQICDPTQNAAAFSPNVGATCGSAATECSAQDTCNAQGACAANHLGSGSLCGNRSSSACDQPDTCDGNGTCSPRRVNSGPCDDGRFCTVNDSCQNGTCVATPRTDCGANRTCVAEVDECRCTGCLVGNTCFAAGEVNRENTCDRCDPGFDTTRLRPTCNCTKGTLDCESPTGGTPNCSNWDFESGTTEGWVIDTEFTGNLSAHDGPLTIATTPTPTAPSGSRSLAVKFRGERLSPTNKNTIWLKKTLCGGEIPEAAVVQTVNGVTVSKKFTALFYFETAADSTVGPVGQANVVYVDGGLAFDFYSDPITGLGGGGGYPQYGSTPQGWQKAEFDFSERFETYRQNPEPISEILIRLLLAPSWRGTIYVDDIRIF